nr:ferric/cupric reductase transmembrane component 2 [Quercus suber]
MASAAAFKAKLLAAEQTNLKAAKFWGVGIAGLIGVFIVQHWVNKLARRYVSKGGSSAKIVSTVSTPFQRLFAGTAIGGTVILPGRIWLGLAYLAINVACAFTNVNWVMAELFFAKRMGWIHISGLFKYNSVYVLRNTHQYAAMTAGISLLIILLSVLLRQRRYELFYVIHIVFAVVILITGKKNDLLNAGTKALPEGATRVTLQRGLSAAPGSHAFLYIPGVRAFETHPFSLFATNPAEFVVNARDGFTRSLHQAAVANSGKKLRAAIEGPYGQPPAVLDFDKVVIIAGGSGATFCLSMALAWAQGANNFPDYLEWFGPEMAELQSCTAVQLLIHVTRGRKGVVEAASSIVDEKSKNIDSQEIDARRSFSSGSSSLDKNVEYGRPDIRGILSDAMKTMSVEKTTLVAGRSRSLPF